MRSAWVYLLTVLSASVILTSCGTRTRESGLQITYRTNGIQRLTFNGVVLEDLTQYPSDVFHIWHLKTTGLNGKVLTDRQYGWGEVNNGHSWDAANHTWLYSFIWGSISLQFIQQGNNLGMKVTETNKADSGIRLDGATIYPFVLHFPELPSGFGDPAYEHLAVNVSDPTPIADFGSGQVSVIADTDSKQLYRGFEPAGNGNNYFPIISSTPMDSMSATYPRIDRPVTPGTSDSFTVSLYFSESRSEGQ
jgi:hypothetical protein